MDIVLTLLPFRHLGKTAGSKRLKTESKKVLNVFIVVID